ncbi:glycosyltransferase [Clostridium perfringens]|uniref:glycosyltransferase n=1 Tax=Clostridium perfringens TaxID=1502 RepID=UPI001CAACE37|nr:glycosyltransferase [Clostridium perfringens]STB61367.1 glycosyltransferase family 28 protein [Clostridium perfringens]
MIFVTVGTHEQPFDRLIKYIDSMKQSGKIKDDVIIQTGFSNYNPQNCIWNKLYPYKEMINLVKEARIVVTHGGPSSFIMPLQFGKIPIVVPRLKKYDEHVNDHQLDFAKEVQKRQGNIILVSNIEELIDVINKYDSIINNMPSELKSNNLKFTQNFEKIVKGLF